MAARYLNIMGSPNWSSAVEGGENGEGGALMGCLLMKLERSVDVTRSGGGAFPLVLESEGTVDREGC